MGTRNSSPPHPADLTPLMMAAREISYQMAEADPIGAVRVLARALRRQTRGAKLAAIRHFTEALVAQDPDLSAAVADDLAAIVKIEASNG